MQKRYRRIVLLVAISATATALFFFSLGGCLSVYGYRLASVQVADAETKQPIPGAKVRVSHGNVQLGGALNVPGKKETTTNEDGKTRLLAALYSPQYWTIEAPGYDRQFRQYNRDKPGTLVVELRRVKPRWPAATQPHTTATAGPGR